jgi:thiol peroxidase
MGSQVTLRGQTVPVSGNFPKVGDRLASWTLTAVDLSEKTSQDFAGQRVVMNIFPSLDTPTCAASVRKFNQMAVDLNQTVVLCISADLPFAQQRFCGAEGLDKVHGLSTFRHPEFLNQQGVLLAGGPLASLAARAVIIIDPQGVVMYSELVSEIAHEPNYEAALNALA